MHSSQAVAERAIRCKADPVVRNLGHQFFVIDKGLDVHRGGLGVPQYVGHAFLDHAIDGLREQAINIVEARIDAVRQREIRRLRTRILEQGGDALFESELLNIKRPQ